MRALLRDTFKCFYAGLALAHLCLLPACITTQHEVQSAGEAIDAASMLTRVQDVAFPLLLASAEWCPFDLEATYGFFLADRQASGNGGRDGSWESIVVSYVHPWSPAASVDLRLGDQILEVNTRDVKGIAAEEVMGLVRSLTRARIQPLQLDVFRLGRRHRLYLDAVPACQFSLRVIPTEQINAFSNGRQVAVTTGLMRFVRSDDELAWVLAHEIAHNVLGHVENAKLQAMLSALLGATVGEPASLSAPPRSLEAQADYLGSYVMVRAGYDLQAVRRVWQRLRQLELQQGTAGRQTSGWSHPTADERLASFEATVREIEEKRARGELLKPGLEQRP